MPRTFSRPSSLYQAGTFGPFALDGFTRGNADYIEWTLTVEGWPPAADPAVTISGEWSNGQTFGATYPGAPPAKGPGIATQVSGRADIPKGVGPDGTPEKKNVTSGTITLTAHVDLRTAVTLRAV